MKPQTSDGDTGSFDRNWQTRAESLYTHWRRGDPENQIQLAFRNHWTLFNELFAHPGFNRGKRVLEVGCGRGSLSCYFADAGYQATLLDYSAKVIEIARGIFAANELDAEFVVGDANQLPFEDESFDVTFSIGLLEHFEDIHQPLREQVRILAPGGMFLGYIVPEYRDNAQAGYRWINEVLKGYAAASQGEVLQKASVYRSDDGSEKYVPMLEQLGLKDVKARGVYPLPMISHSIDFPFSLMPPSSEAAVVRHFQAELDRRRSETGKHPWMCEEGYGQAFLVWGIK